MSLLKPIIMLLIISCSLSVLFKKRVEDTIPLTTTGIVVYLYVFYILNILNISFYILITISTILFILALHALLKDKKTIKEKLLDILTPGFLIFLIAIVIIIPIILTSYVGLWDELRLWGAYPKILFFDGSIQLNNNALLGESMMSYLPGMSLFQYFFLKCANSFYEPILFLSYAIFGLSIMLPFTKNIKRKNFVVVLLVSLLFVILPLAFANNPEFDNLAYYKTLYIDPMLGMMFAYIMVLSINNVYESNFKILSFYLALASILLFKNTAILFAIIAIMSSILCEVFVYKNLSWKKIFKILLPIIFVITIYLSWKIMLNIYDVHNEHTSVMNIEGILKLLMHPTDEQNIIIANTMNAFCKTPLFVLNILGTSNILNFFTLFAVFIGMLIAISCCLKEKQQKSFIIGSILITLGSVFFAFGLILLFVFSLKGVYSYGRYINTTMTALLFFTVFMLLQVNFSSEKKHVTKYMKITTSIILLLILVCFPLYNINSLNDNFNTIDYYSKSLSQIIKNGAENNDEENRVLCIMDNNEGLWNMIFNHQIYLELIGTHVTVPMDAMYTINMDTSEEEFEKIYQEGKYNYIFILSLNNELPQWFLNKFSSKPTVHSLYYQNELFDVVASE